MRDTSSKVRRRWMGSSATLSEAHTRYLTHSLTRPGARRARAAMRLRELREAGVQCGDHAAGADWPPTFAIAAASQTLQTPDWGWKRAGQAARGRFQRFTCREPWPVSLSRPLHRLDLLDTVSAGSQLRLHAGCRASSVRI